MRMIWPEVSSSSPVIFTNTPLRLSEVARTTPVVPRRSSCAWIDER